MKYLLSHATAVEYWKLVGLPGIRRPQPSFSQAIPKETNGKVLRELVQAGLITLPVHQTCSKRTRCSDPRMLRIHNRTQPLPLGTIYNITESIGITSPELTLVQAMTQLNFIEAVALLDEFCGFYSPNESSPIGMISRSPLTTVDNMLQFTRSVERINGLNQAKTAVLHALDRSRSPMETAAVMLLALPCMRGGYGLKGAVVNNRIELDRGTQAIAKVRTLEPDILWPEAKVCVEYDSAEFHGNETRIANDARRKNALTSAGYTVVTLTSKQINNAVEFEGTAEYLSRKLHRAMRKPDHRLRDQLRRELLAGDSVVKRQFAFSERCGQVLPQR